MKTTFRSIGLCVTTVLLATHASAVVLDFNDLPTFADPGSPTGITGGFFANRPNAAYNGFQFGNTNSATWFWNPNPAAPGEPYNGVGHTQWVGLNVASNFSPAITSTVDFVFNGASFAGYDPIRYHLSLNGAPVGPSTTCNLTLVQAFCASGYNGLIDSVVIENLTPVVFAAGAYYAMDNFTYNAAPVPEPGSWALMAAGLAAVALVARRRERAA